jgi:quinol-cytochrome oxidoreductase complex cytochrome b subunit
MRRGYGWQHGMRWINRGRWWPGRWGVYRRPCCCLFFTLPVLLIPILAVEVILFHFAGIHIQTGPF